MNWRILLACFAVSLASCATRVEKYQPIDQTEKSITVPPGSLVVGPIKTALRQSGWQVLAYPTLTHTPTGTQRAAKTRYILEIDAQFYDYEFPTFKKMFHYNLSVVDTKTYEEAFSINGSGTEKEIVTVLMENLK